MAVAVDSGEAAAMEEVEEEEEDSAPREEAVAILGVEEDVVVAVDEVGQEE